MKTTVGKYYVLDTWAPSPQELIVEGPFDRPEDAERSRLDLNIDGDCVIVQLKRLVDGSAYYERVRLPNKQEA